MSRFPEMTYAVYADGELCEEEARQVEVHLAGCPRCRALVDALQTENRVLRELLQSEETVPVPVNPLFLTPVQAWSGGRLLWTVAAWVAAAAAVQTGLEWLSEIPLPAGFSWLNPFSQDVPLSVFFYSLGYLIQKGSTMLNSIISTVAMIVLAFSAAAGGLLLLRRRPPRPSAW